MVKINIKESIIDYSNDNSYFHINDLKRYFTKEGIKFKENSLKQQIYLFKKEKIIFPAGRGWYSNIQKEFNLNTQPINKIMKLLLEKFPLLKFSCWSTEQLKGFFHHLPNQFVTFIYVENDFLSTLKDFLMENNYNVYLNPSKIEAEKFIELKTKTIILKPSIVSRVSNENNSAKIEKILVDLFMEIKKISLIDKEEYKKIISNIIFDYRINIAKMLDYAHNRKMKDQILNIMNLQN